MFQHVSGNLAFFQKGRPIFLKDLVSRRRSPFYLYDLDAMERRLDFLLQSRPSARFHVFFAVKSNSNLQILRLFQKKGIGADVVSAGELKRAVRAGFSPRRIVFSGAGKTEEELLLALRRRALQIHVESVSELKAIARLSRKLSRPASAALRPSVALRVNLNADIPSSHPYIKTGRLDHKFGLSGEELQEALAFLRSPSGRHARLKGLSAHLGSQIFDLRPLFKALKTLKALYEEIEEEFQLKTLDIGGGLGVDYKLAPTAGSADSDEALIESFSRRLRRLFQGFKGSVFMEPGRILTARFGLLCARVEYLKERHGKTFAIVRTGMHHFLRPALYGASHRIWPFQIRPGKSGAMRSRGLYARQAMCWPRAAFCLLCGRGIGWPSRTPELMDMSWPAGITCTLCLKSFAFPKERGFDSACRPAAAPQTQLPAAARSAAGAKRPARGSGFVKRQETAAPLQ